MFLQRLREYADRSSHALPPAFQETPIRYNIQFNAQGYSGVTENTGTGREKQGRLIVAPHARRAAGIKAKLLVDNGEYTLGWARAGNDQSLVKKRHQAYMELLRDCAQETSLPFLFSIIDFLEHFDQSCILKEKPDFDPTANITFQLDGDEYLYPFDHPSIRTYWARKNTLLDEATNAMECLVCGECRPAVERLSIPIKGIPGGQASGMMIISADKPAFESYGLKASHIAPVCEVCAEQFSNALNTLLQRHDTHVTIPPLVTIFWTKEAPFSLNISDLLAADSQQVKNLYDSPWKAKADNLQIDKNDFYTATLSASGARVVVRDWAEISISNVIDHLQHYFMFQRIQNLSGDFEHFPVQRLARATINRSPTSKEEVFARVVQELMHLALHGGSLSFAILQKVLHRIRADRKVIPEQAALLKMFFLSRLSEEKSMTIVMKGGFLMASLSDTDTKTDAYLCGQVFAMLDYIQYLALGKLNAGITDKNFGTAMIAPALVFPRLLRGSTTHLKSIRQEKSSGKGYMDYWETRLSQLIQLLPHTLPQTLSLEQQGQFALGFYQQKAQFADEKQKYTQKLHDQDTSVPQEGTE